MQKNKIGIIIGVIVAIILGGVGFYYGYYVRTPEYSLNIIRDSIKKHDVNTFEKYVNIDKVSNSYIDETIDFAIEEQKGLSAKDAEDARFYIEKDKPSHVSDIKNIILNAVEGKSDAPDADPNDIRDITKDSKVRGIAYVKKDGNKATVGIKVNDEILEDNYVIEFLMEQLSDGKWQVTEILNLKEYFQAIEVKKKADLKKYFRSTQPIIDEINKKWDSITRSKMSKLEREKALLELDKERGAKLAEIPVPAGAKDVADKREKSLQLQMEMFQMFIDAKGKPNRETVQKINKLDADRDEIEKEIERAKVSVDESK
ncbi:MAG: hypothetical protein SPL62_07940 [Selenomonas sp.]|nr:hypothetical protein [Selenomonas sp.]